MPPTAPRTTLPTARSSRSRRDGADRTTYGKVYDRSRQMASALEKLGIAQGDRVATLAWNTASTSSLCGGCPAWAPCCTRSTCACPRSVTYITNHAEDQVMFVDAALLPRAREAGRRSSPRCATIVMRPRALPAEQPAERDRLRGAAGGARPITIGRRLDENSACAMCYTSGTTGNPKGAVYSHRSMFLHSIQRTWPTRSRLREAMSSCRWCRCSMPTPGAALRRHAGGREAGLPGRIPRWQEPGRADPERACNHLGRRADDLDGLLQVLENGELSISPASA